MQEFIKVKIFNPIKPLGELINEADYFKFGYEDPSIMISTLGQPILIEGNSILFSTQNYDENVPLSVANTGNKVILYKDLHKTDYLAKGIIEQKYFTKATKNSFRTDEALNSNNSVAVDCDLSFSSDEKEALVYGFTPLSQDDRWFYFAEGSNTVRFFRSWTGIEYFSGELVQQTDDMWKFEKARIHLNGMNLFKDKIILSKILKGHLERKVKLFQ